LQNGFTFTGRSYDNTGDDAQVYDPRETSVGGTHALFIFRGAPEEYNLPASPEVPTVHLRAGWQSAAVAAGVMLAGVALAFFQGPRRRYAPD
jgi:hypothetical protein